MKIFFHMDAGPVKEATMQVAKALGAETVETIEEADRTLCRSAQEAYKILRQAKGPIDILADYGHFESAKAFAANHQDRVYAFRLDQFSELMKVWSD